MTVKRIKKKGFCVARKDILGLSNYIKVFHKGSKYRYRILETGKYSVGLFKYSESDFLVNFKIK